jgi:hypothetical protein
MKCRAELCPSWIGEGCICAVMGIEPKPAPALDDLYDAPEGPHPAAGDPRGLGPIFTAGHHSEDTCCGDGIVPGEDIRADGAGGWIHADDQCEKLAARQSASGGRAIACPSCFMIHGRGQRECQ